MLYRELMERKRSMKLELEIITEQVEIFRKFKKGDLVYSEYQYVSVAQHGVSTWILSTSPTLLKCKDWQYEESNFTIRFDVIATKDPVPYHEPYDRQYSGKQAKIYAPNFNSGAIPILRKMRVVPDRDILLYINYPYKAFQFSDLFK